MTISKYNDIKLNRCTYYDITDYVFHETGIKFDWFDYYMQNGGKAEIFNIQANSVYVGYVVFYNVDEINKTIDIFGKVTKKLFTADLLKALLSLMNYIFISLQANKINFIYREDNYYYDDVCRFLKLVKEGILRDSLFYSGEYCNINSYGILRNEYLHYFVNEYSKMFTWDYAFNPINYLTLDIESELNCRSFTNALNNPNQALMNDILFEFALNKNEALENYLEYKNVKFPVKIFDMDAKYDSLICQGQLLEVPEKRYDDILLVTTAQFGYKDSFLTVVYSNDEIENVKFTLSDWCEHIVRDEHIIHNALGCRQMGVNGNVIKCDSHLYLKRIPILRFQKIKGIRLPINHDIFIYSINLTVHNTKRDCIN